MQSARILIVEDIAPSAKALQRLLQELGYTVTGIAETGDEAIAQAMAQRPDLVLMDISLAGPMDGIHAAAVIADKGQIPIVFLTGYHDDATLERANVTGPWGYLLKPYTIEALRSTLAVALYKSQMERRMRAVEHWLAAAMQTLGTGVVTTDREGRITTMNTAAAVLTGWCEASAQGRHVAEVLRLIDRESGAPVADMVTQVLADGMVAGLSEYALLLVRHGPPLPIEQYAAPIRDPAGQIIGVSLAFREAGELHAARTALRDSELRFEAIFHQTAAFLSILYPDGTLVESNSAAFAMGGLTPDTTLGQPFWDTGWWNRSAIVQAALKADIAAACQGQTVHRESLYFAADGTERSLDMTLTPIRNASGLIAWILVEGHDITERKQLATILRQRQREFATLVEHAPDMVFRLDTQLRHLYINAAAGQVCSIPTEQFLGKTGRELGLLGVACDLFEAKCYEALATGEETHLEFSMAARYYRSRLVPERAPNGSVESLLGITEDITIRKQAEEALRRAHDDLEQRVQERTLALQHTNDILRAEIEARQRAEAVQQQLLACLVTAQEEERHRVSRELHDHLGQTLSALMLRLKSLEGNLPETSLQPIQTMAATLVRDVQSLAWTLRTPGLEERGLEVALSDYVEAWSHHSGIIADFFSSGFTKQRLPAYIETTLYRIVQEALTNVLKHARAQRASVLLEYRRDHILAIVEDDGIGFDVEARRHRPSAGHLGLVGMQERATLVGGTVELESTPGSGTTMFVRLPLPEPQPLAPESTALSQETVL